MLEEIAAEDSRKIWDAFCCQVLLLSITKNNIQWNICAFKISPTSTHIIPDNGNSQALNNEVYSDPILDGYEDWDDKDKGIVSPISFQAEFRKPPYHFCGMSHVTEAKASHELTWQLRTLSKVNVKTLLHQTLEQRRRQGLNSGEYQGQWLKFITHTIFMLLTYGGICNLRIVIASDLKVSVALR